ncbi:diguanylate cyclase [Xanthomonadaceae bacterium JHOS43]|nr:diguanylate cyclase [Xanthomonadaceae bacterium JHOS43]
MQSVLPSLWLWILLLVPLVASAQDDCARLLEEAVEVTRMRDSDASAGLARGEALLEELRTAESPCAEGEAMLRAAVGANLHILGRIEEAVQYYREAQQVLPRDAASDQFATVYRGAGVALGEAEQFDAALESYLAALGASRAAGDRLEAGKTAGNIGNLYSTLGDLEQSRRFHLEALEDFEAARFQPGVAGTLINLGALAAKVATTADEAGDEVLARREAQQQRDYNERALALFTELGNDRGVAYASANIGMALQRLGQPEHALEHHLRALELRRRVGDAIGELLSKTTLASTLTALGRHDEAQQMLDSARAALPEGKLGLALDVAREQAVLDEARGDLAGALQAQREINRLQWALAAEAHSAQVEKLQSRFRFDQQAREIDLLRSEAEINALQLDRQRMLVRVGLLVAMLLGLVVVLLYSRLRMGRTAARELEQMARTDPLTGLVNRRSMGERIQAEILRARRSGRAFSLLMIDVDGFKSINDKHGHDRGDQILVRVAGDLRSGLRGQDLLARWGGEEFLALLPETTAEGAAAVAERLRLRVGGSAETDSDAGPPVTVTLGVAAWRPEMDVETCVKAADQAMYTGKRQGGNRVMMLD